MGLAILDSDARKSIHSWKPVSNRMLVARFRGTISTSVIVAYAPHSGQRAERKAFFRSLQDTLNEVPGMDFLMLLGDFNSKVGSAASARSADSYGGSLGRHGVGNRNSCGEELLQFASRNKLAVANTFHQHKAAHKFTHRSNLPDAAGPPSLAAGLHCLDYVMVRRRWLSAVQDVRVRAGANPGWTVSDHHPLVATVKLKLRAPSGQRPQRPGLYNRQALRDEDTCTAFAADVTARLAAQSIWAAAPSAAAAAQQPAAEAARFLESLNRPTSPPSPPMPRNPPPSPPTSAPQATPNALFSAFRAALMESAAAQLPTVQRKRSDPWITDSTLQLIASRRQTMERLGQLEAQKGVHLQNQARTRSEHAQWVSQLQQLQLTIHQLHRLLKQRRHAIKRAIAQDKRKFAANLAAQMKAAAGKGDTAAFWGVVNKAREPLQPRRKQSGIASADGRLQLHSDQQAETFAEHFRQVLGSGQPVSEQTLESIRCPTNPEPAPVPTVGEVTDAIQRLKRGRAADAEGLSAELLQAAGGRSIAALHQLVEAAWLQGMPTAVKRSELIPLHKKGDHSLPGNYRGIQLISIIRKVIALVISSRLTTWAEGHLLEHQCGFRPKRSCADQLFGLRQLTDLAVLRQHRLHFCFVDLQKAFDSISRPALWAILRARGLSEQMVRILEDLHTDTQCAVRVGNSRSRHFDTPWGVQQGDPIAGLLFNIYIDHVAREAMETAQQAAQEEGVQLGVQMQYRISSKGRFWETPPQSSPSSTLTLPMLLLADDLAAVASSAVGLALFMRHLEAACQRWGLVISPTKTECMVVDGREQLSESSSLEATRCQICLRKDGESSMLLCECCEQGWHMGCLPTPMEEVPEGQWQCSECEAAAASSGGSDHINRNAPISIGVGGKQLEWVRRFKYLGSLFNSAGNLDAELRRRCQQAIAAFQQLSKPLWRQRCVGTPTKMGVYRALVSSVLLYASHSWAPTTAQLEMLEVLQRHHLRQILGVRRIDKMPNETLLERCQQPTIASQLHQRRGHWIGHVLRMGDERLAKQLLYSELPGKRRQGRPGRSLAAQFQIDVKSSLSSQQLKNVAEEAADKASWNELFSVTP